MKQQTIALIIEDEDAIIQVVSKKLKSLGHNIKIAKNQDSANFLLKRQTFDYILLDLKIPVTENDMDPDSNTGFNLLQQIREKHTQEELPVIIMTAGITSAVVVMKKGANDFVEKPFKVNELEDKIRGILHAEQSNEGE